jgi:hypothetical protein
MLGDFCVARYESIGNQENPISDSSHCLNQ